MKKINTKLKKILFIFFITIILLVIFYIYKYLFSNNKFIVVCIFHETTGLLCPGCGVTRALISLSNLEFYQAFRYNQLMFVWGPMILYDFFRKIYFWVFNKKIKKIPTFVWIIIIIVLLIFGILRNIPGYEYLRPTKL